MIPQIKKILYATDLSKNSSYAFLYATDIARRHDAKIVILHVIESIPPYAEAYAGITMRRNGNSRKRLLKTSKNTYRDFVKKQRLKLVLHVLNLYPKFSFIGAIPQRKY